MKTYLIGNTIPSIRTQRFLAACERIKGSELADEDVAMLLSSVLEMFEPEALEGIAVECGTLVFEDTSPEEQAKLLLKPENYAKIKQYLGSVPPEYREQAWKAALDGYSSAVVTRLSCEYARLYGQTE